MKFRRNLASALGLTALLACSGTEPITAPPKTKPPQQQIPPLAIISSPKITCYENELYLYPTIVIGGQGSRTYTMTKPSWLKIDQEGLITGICPEVFKDSLIGVEWGVSEPGLTSVTQKYDLGDRNKFNIYVLSPTQSQAPGISADTGFTFTVNPDTSISFPYAVGMVPPDRVASGITPQTPEGLLREIISVSSDKRRVYTKQGILEETVRKASIPFSKELLPSDMQSSSGIAGISPISEMQGDFSFSYSFKNAILYDNGKNGQIIANGSFYFNLDLNLDMDIDLFTLNKLVFQQTLGDSAELTIGSNLIGLAASYEKSLKEFKFKPIVIGTLPTVPPIPVVVVPKAEIVVGIDPSTFNPAGITINQKAELIARLGYEEGIWGTNINFLNEVSASNSVTDGEWKLKAYIGPRLSLQLYGIAGPFAGANAYLKLQTQTEKWQLYGGLEASLGAAVKILGKKITAFSKNIPIDSTLLAEGSGTITPSDTNRILFTSKRDGNGEIYIMNPDGSKQINLTNNPAWDTSPSWSHDRRKIAFVSDREENRQIYIMNVDGSNPEKITSNIYAEDPTWSPDGSQIVFTQYFGSSPRNIYLLDLNTGNLNQLTNSQSSHPSWSPDGKKIAFMGWDGDYEIYVMNSDGSTNPVNLTNNGYLQWDKSPSWSPDGSRIAFQSDRDGNMGIYIMNADGSSPVNISNDPNTYDVHPSWSPDGKKIAYASSLKTDPYYDIWIMNADGSGKTRLTNTPTIDDNNPRWSR